MEKNFLVLMVEEASMLAIVSSVLLFFGLLELKIYLIFIEVEFLGLLLVWGDINVVMVLVFNELVWFLEIVFKEEGLNIGLGYLVEVGLFRY